MRTRLNRLKIALIAAAAALGLSAGFAPAAARTVCNGYGDCWYVRDTRDYYRHNYYDRHRYQPYWHEHRGYYNSYGRYRPQLLCDRDGYCRWDYNYYSQGGYYDRGDYYGRNYYGRGDYYGGYGYNDWYGY